MRFSQIMVMGAGAVGGFFGARIAEHSTVKVTLIARGLHLETIQRDGLQIKSPDGDSTVELEAYEDPKEADPPDLILFTVKSYDTEQAIEAIKPVVNDRTQILTIQNGIENYDKLADAFGEERVIQGFCRIGASVTAPGTIEHKSMGSVVVGEPDGGESDRLEELRGLFRNTSIDFSISRDIWRDTWAKFTWNCIFNMATAVAEVTVDKLFENEITEELCYNLFREIQSVAAREGIILNEQDRERIIENSRSLKGFTTSTYNDRQKGKKLEYEAFTGALLRLGNKHELELPHNHTMYAFLKLID